MVLGKKLKAFIGTVGMMRGKKLSFYGTVSKAFGTVSEESEKIMGYRVIVSVME